MIRKIIDYQQNIFSKIIKSANKKSARVKQSKAESIDSKILGEDSEGKDKFTYLIK
jgi:hypothetical protein